MKEKADSLHTSVGLWLSPWGGYNKPRDIRVSHAKENGFETVDGKFVLSGPNYFRNFNEQIIKLIKDEHITSFKLDVLVAMYWSIPIGLAVILPHWRFMAGHHGVQIKPYWVCVTRPIKNKATYLDLTKSFEIPSGETTSFTLKPIYGTNATLAEDYHKPLIVTLQPLETLVVEAAPVANKK